MSALPRRSGPASVSRPRIPAVAILAAAFAVALGACGGGATGPAALDGLVVLAGGNGAASLVAYDATGATRDLPLPGASTTWIAVSSRGDAVATLDDGSLHVAERIDSSKPGAWTAEHPTSAGGGPLDGPFLFPRWSPDGGRVAALVPATDPTATRLVIHDPRTDGTLPLPLEGAVESLPPSWIDADRVGVVRNDGGAHALVLVDVGSGDVTPAGRSFEALDAAPDADRIAVLENGGTTIRVYPLAQWLGGGGDPLATIDLPDVPNQLVLDRRAERLAVVFAGRDGAPAEIRVFGAGGRWGEARRVSAPAGASRAQAAWLP